MPPPSGDGAPTRVGPGRRRPAGLDDVAGRRETPARIIELFLADLTAAHGSVRGYARDALGVDDALVSALRERLPER
ncbi:tyrosine-protein phosphatase [Micromonospora palomenae]|uniref:tyrosine-protein phosphatase n=1 Tax=Micromonospora palomenae TaxID=1461247 RepID=UPI0012B7D2BE|nr:tyrosine-protein phosphatase [Micromonospora palomenae]